MSWYKKSLALPTIRNRYPDEPSTGLMFLDEALTDEHAQELSEPGMKYLGSGDYGTAFIFNNKNVVKKYTGDNMEIETALGVFEKQTEKKPLPGLVFIYEVKDISNEVYEHKKKVDESVTPEQFMLYELTLERVSSLNNWEKNLYGVNFYYILKDIKKDPSITNEVILENLTTADMTDREVDVLNIIINFARVIADNGYINTDLHSGNVGIRNGKEMVVLDLGAIQL